MNTEKENLQQPSRPSGLRLTPNENGYSLVWEPSENTEGYYVCMDGEKLLATQDLSCNIPNEMNGYLSVVAYNSAFETESDLVRTATPPNKPHEIEVLYSKNGSGYKFDASFLDNSFTEDGYRVKYQVDNNTQQTIELQDDYILSANETQDSEVAYKLWRSLQSNEDVINVADGLEGEIKSGEIRGQSIKCITDKFYGGKMTGQQSVVFIETNFIYLNPSSLYTVSFKVSDIRLVGSGTGLNFSYTKVDGTQVGFNFMPKNAVKANGYYNFTFTSPSQMNYMYRLAIHPEAGATLGDVVTISDITITEGINTLQSSIPYGLHSTTPQIQVNNTTYKYYNPYLEGKSTLYKSPKSTTTWTEITHTETRDTNQFKYKLESVSTSDTTLATLGTINGTIDKFDNGTLKLSSKELVLNGTEAWADFIVEPSGLGRARLRIPNMVRSTENTKTDYVVSDILTSVGYEGSNRNEFESICAWYNDTGIVVYLKDVTNLNMFKDKLGVILPKIRYQLASIETVALSDTQIKSYTELFTDDNLIELPFEEDKLILNMEGTETIVHGHETLVLSGLEEWTEDTTSTNTNKFTMVTGKLPLNTKGICSHYTYKDITTLDEVGCFVSTDGTLTIRDSKITLEEFKTKLKTNPVTIKFPKKNPTQTTIHNAVNDTIRLVSGTNKITSAGSIKASGFDLIVPVQKPRLKTSFIVPSVSEKVSVTVSSYNANGENSIDPILFYNPPSFRWAYLTSTTEVLLEWIDNCLSDTQYKIKYRIGNGAYQYVTVEGDGATTGRKIQHKLPLTTSQTMDVSVCSVTSQDGFYSEEIRVSRDLDVNQKPPSNFTYTWKTDNTAEFTWVDNYDCDEAYEFYHSVDGAAETKVDVVATDKVGKGAVYKQTVNIPLSSTCRARVRMKYDLNESNYAYLTVTRTLDTPTNIQVATVGTTTTITWNEVTGAEGYKVYLDSKLVDNVTTTQCVINREINGFISVSAYNSKVESTKSEQTYIKTMPNPALWTEVGYEETALGYDVKVEFTDNSIIETHYKVQYSVDDSTVQTYTIDTENMELPPDTVLDEEKTYLMWSEISKTDGTDVEIQGVKGEEIKDLKISGNTDNSGYYPMSVGTIDPITLKNNEVETPIRFTTKIKSQGEEKPVVDVARFQDIDIIIEGKTVRDEVNKTLNSVKPMIYNKPKSLAHTITLDHVKGYTNVVGGKLQNNEAYGSILGRVGDAIDKRYKDKTVYSTKQYEVTGRESWLLDNSKTSATYTTITNVKLASCPTYGTGEKFKMISNCMTPYPYSDTGYSHLRVCYTDKLTIMIENSKAGISSGDSTSNKISKCKNYLVGLGASIRYEMVTQEEVAGVVDFFVGDSFELGGIGDVKDVCNTKTGEVRFVTKEIVLDGSEDWLKNPLESLDGNYLSFALRKYHIDGSNFIRLCDRFEYVDYGSYISQINKEYICSDGNSSNNYFVSIAKSKLSSNTEEGFKQWLKVNPITIRYQLAPEYHHSDKINILQDTFVVNSEDGGDKEVEIVNNHFEENELIQDGLMVQNAHQDISYSYTQSYEFKSTSLFYSGEFNFSKLGEMGGYHGSLFGVNLNNVSWIGYIRADGNGLYINSNSNDYLYFVFTFELNTTYNIQIIYADTWRVFVDGVELKRNNSSERHNREVPINTIILGKLDYGSPNGFIKNQILYKKSLTPQEFNHLLEVLKSIKSEHKTITLDYDTSKVKQLFCSDTDRVEDRTGRTQEEINRTFYKRNCKEFVADANGEIKVDNGEQGYVLSGSIEGQTVKNILSTSEFYRLGVVQSNGYIKMLSTRYDHIIADISQLAPNTPYTILFDILKNDYSKTIRVSTCNATNQRIIPSGTTGIFAFNTQSLTTFGLNDFWLWSDINGTGDFIFKIAIIEGHHADTINTYIPFGLTSTEASITSNGTKHTFYASEEDKANQKPISLPFLDDKFTMNEDGSGTWVDASVKNVITGDEKWILEGLSTGGTHRLFRLADGIQNPANVNIEYAKCDKYEYIKWINGWHKRIDKTYVGFAGTNAGIGISLPTSTANTLEELKQHLKTTGGFMFVYQTDTPTTTHIPKSIMPTIPTDKINILQEEN